MRALLLLSPLCCLGWGGCIEPVVPINEHPAGEYVQVADVPPQIGNQVDLLFVVDNTEGMLGKQLALTSSFERLLSHFSFTDLGMPDLHVGVISADLGVADDDVAGCTIAGDRGLLQSTARIPGCAPPDGNFLVDRPVPGTGSEPGGQLREVNYDGTLASSFQCISQLGDNGCAYEQPLEAMRRALDEALADNAGFSRPDAVLAVVFLTNEDDCSASDPGIFDPLFDGKDGINKFRCFKEGVRCDGDDVFQPGMQEGCVPYEASSYLHDVQGYADFLIDHKPDPGKLIVTGMMGDADIVTVEQTLDEREVLLPSCVGSGGPAYPAVRLQGLLDALPGQGEVSSLCGDEAFAPLTGTARRIRKALGTACLERDLRDADPVLAGLQPDCRVTAVYPDGSEEAIPPCDDPVDHTGSGPAPYCHAIKAGGAACGDFPSQLALHMNWGGPDARAPLGTHTIVECRVER